MPKSKGAKDPNAPRAKRGPGRPIATRLTPKEQAFCEHFVVDPSPSRAAKAAGYAWATSDGHSIYMKPKVQAEIKRLQAIREKRILMTRDRQLEILAEMIEDPTTKKADKIKAMTLRSKMLGELIERREHSGPNGDPIRFEDLTGVPTKKLLEELDADETE